MRPFAFMVCVALQGCATGGTETAADAHEGGTDSGGIDTQVDTGDPDTGTLDTGTVDTGSSSDTGADAETSTDTGLLPCPPVDVEPNDDETKAIKLKDIDDCDGSGSNFAGVVSGGADVDVFRYRGTDTFGCVVDPTASTTDPVRLCLFVRCSSFLTKINSCPKGLPQTWGTTGISGCCTDSGGAVQVDYTCTDVGTSDTADVFMRIDKPGATTCENYSVKYHF